MEWYHSKNNVIAGPLRHWVWKETTHGAKERHLIILKKWVQYNINF